MNTVSLANVKTVSRMIPVKRIKRNPQQPRIVFDPDELKELADSIREHGVIQPITVNRGDTRGDYILCDGERRWRAAQLAGLLEIPAQIGPRLNGTGPRERLERALVANIQRSEMHPIEEGLAYRKMMRDFQYKIHEVAKRTGKAYTRVHYCLTLLKLEKKIQGFMLARQLPCGADTVTALLSVPKGPERVELANALAKCRATAIQVRIACTKYNHARLGLKSKRTRGSLAERVIEDTNPEWDALYQLGKVPPWPAVTNSVMATCDACPLRKIASDATCRDCGLVVFLRKLMEAQHVH